MLAESMSAESMAEYYDAAEQFESSSDESEVCTQKTYWSGVHVCMQGFQQEAINIH